MPRKRRRPKARAGQTPADVVAFLLHGDGHDLSVIDEIKWTEVFEIDRSPNEWRTFDTCWTGSAKLPGWWEELSDVLVSSWIATWPGTRPFGWWFFEAPRWEEHAGRKHPDAEPRRQVGGIGTPLSWSYEFGLPRYFVSEFDEAYYNGRAVDVYGQPIGRDYRPGQFAGRAIDPNDPPRFESQATYLDRHGLLTPAERRKLTAKDFADERIEPVSASMGVEQPC